MVIRPVYAKASPGKQNLRMNMKQFFKLLPAFIGLLILPGCATYYKKRSLSYLQLKPRYKKTQEQITLEITKLEERQIRSLFDGQGKYLLRVGAQPLYLRIINDSNHTYYLHPANITLTRISNEQINTALAQGMSPVLGTLAQGLIPSALFSYIVVDTAINGLTAISLNFFGPAVFIIGVVAIFSIPVMLYSCYQKNNEVNEYNRNLSEDIRGKNIPESLKIPADTTQEFLFFADATQFTDTFSITLTEKLTQTPLLFNVTL